MKLQLTETELKRAVAHYVNSLTEWKVSLAAIALKLKVNNAGSANAGAVFEAVEIDLDELGKENGMEIGRKPKNELTEGPDQAK